MRALDFRYWPIWVAIGFMIVAAAMQGWTQSVPNWLTFSAVLAAWVTGWCVSRGDLPSAGGGIRSALLLSLLGLLLLLPCYAVGILGAGCAKASMVLGGWIGCAVSLQRGAKWLLACTAGGGLMAVAGAWLSRQYGMTSEAIGLVFPAQASLSLGAIFVLVAMLKQAHEPDLSPGDGSLWNNSPSA